MRVQLCCALIDFTIESNFGFFRQFKEFVIENYLYDLEDLINKSALWDQIEEKYFIKIYWLQKFLFFVIFFFTFLMNCTL